MSLSLTLEWVLYPYFSGTNPSLLLSGNGALDVDVWINIETIGGSRGGAPSTRPPYGSRFFRFDMQNFRNVAASGVHGPSYEVHAPPYGKSWIRHWRRRTIHDCFHPFSTWARLFVNWWRKTWRTSPLTMTICGTGSSPSSSSAWLLDRAPTVTRQPTCLATA